MLSSADADLVARDPSLPGLATVLDTAKFVETLRGALSAFADASVRPTYVRYKPGTRCLTTYEVDAAGRQWRMHAGAYTPRRWAEMAAARHPVEDNCPNESSILIDDRALVIKLFPEDARLGVVKRLWDPGTRVPLLQKLLPEYPTLHFAGIETLAYNPERRYVGLLRSEETLAVIKIYADGVFANARAATGRQRRSSLFQTPACIGRSRRHRAIVLEWLPGDRLSDLLAAGENSGKGCLQPALHHVGTALAELHRQLRRETIETPARRAEGTLAAARGIRVLWPPFGDRADSLAATIVRALETPAVVQPIHGDFYADQVLLHQGHVGILDLDRACSGDPLSDVGSFVAHLEYAALGGRLAPTLRDLAVEAFLEGYEQTVGAWAHPGIDLHVADALLRLASRPFRTRSTDWVERMSAILDRVEVEISRGRQSASRQVALPVAFHVTDDWQLKLDPEALDTASASRRFARLPWWSSKRALAVSGVRVVRHKAGRRCLIEYDVEVEGRRDAAERVTLIGKVKAKGTDRRTFEMTRALWQREFHIGNDSGISVPEPVGVVPEWRMWLQEKVTGTRADMLLRGPQSALVGRRAAEVVHMIQRTNVPSTRSHTSVDELRILRERLSEIAAERPEWKQRLASLVDGCCTLLASLPDLPPRAVHRDFHPAQLILDGDRVHLLDLDLYAAGDPALDVGNFLAHVTESSLRESRDPGWFGACETAMTHRFLALEPAVDIRRLEVYRLVSLVRHVHISAGFPDRQPFTARILSYCEDQLELASADCTDRPRKAAI